MPQCFLRLRSQLGATTGQLDELKTNAKKDQETIATLNNQMGDLNDLLSNVKMEMEVKILPLNWKLFLDLRES